MPGTHSSVVGGSTAARVLACPPSIDLAAEAPEAPESEYAAEGTALHEAMEFLLGHDHAPEEALGRVFYGVEITRMHIDECLAPAVAAFEEIVGERQFVTERRMAFPGIENAFGTGDVLYTDDDLLGLVDWKFGAGVPVVAEGNAQGLFYLCAARSEFGAAERYRVSFVQPRLDSVTTAEYVDADLDAFEAALRHAVATRQQRRLVKGPHCRWCPALPNCPEHRRNVDEALRMELTAAQLPSLLERVEHVKAWLKGVEELLETTLMAGVPVPGWKLVQTRGQRRWVDEAAAERWLARKGLKVAERRKVQVVSPAQAEAALKRRGLKLDETLYETPPGKLTPAPESDRRPAQQPGAGKIAALGNALSTRLG